MRKIINGRKYDTETATMLAKWDNCCAGDLNFVEETIYRKRTGEYFLYGRGGAMSCYAESEGNNTFTGGSDITPITESEAKEWVEAKANDLYEDIFGEVEE